MLVLVAFGGFMCHCNPFGWKGKSVVGGEDLQRHTPVWQRVPGTMHEAVCEDIDECLWGAYQSLAETPTVSTTAGSTTAASATAASATAASATAASAALSTTAAD